MTIGEKIKSLRTKRGLSQDALADKIGTTRQTIYHWENDVTTPNINDVQRLSDALECNHDYFFNQSNEASVNSTDEVISDVYKGVKRHWRKMYIPLLFGGTAFVGMGLLIRFIISIFFQSFSTPFPGNDIQSTGEKIFGAFSTFALVVGGVLLIAGIVLLIKDRQKQKEYS